MEEIEDKRIPVNARESRKMRERGGDVFQTFQQLRLVMSDAVVNFYQNEKTTGCDETFLAVLIVNMCKDDDDLNERIHRGMQKMNQGN